MNVIRMICYRTESSATEFVAPYFGIAKDEKRMGVKRIVESSADLTPDYENKTLTVTLHSIAANRFNVAAYELAQLLNQTGTVCPSTDLKMIFKTSGISNCQGSRVLSLEPSSSLSSRLTWFPTGKNTFLEQGRKHQKLLRAFPPGCGH